MKDEKIEHKIELSSKHQDFVEHQNHCPLCGSQLKIIVELEIGTYHLREEASCENCDLLTRVKSHRMH